MISNNSFNMENVNRQENFDNYQGERINHWNKSVINADLYAGYGEYYHDRLNHIYGQIIPHKSKVLELGCGQGDLLASLVPAIGVGVDFSKEMITRAQSKHANLSFIKADVHDELNIDETFDYIILSDLINDIWDAQIVFQNLHRNCKPSTKLIINSYSRLWEFPLSIVKKLKLANPVLKQNWFTVEDIRNLLYISGFETIRNWQEIPFPFKIPLLTSIFNSCLVRFWPIKHLALTNFFIARPLPNDENENPLPTASIVIPARNEAGNIEKIFDSYVQSTYKSELVFIEGHSEDGTFERIEENIQGNPSIPCQLHRQTGIGKGNAVREGFEYAKGDIFMIMDADTTVPFEYIPRFYTAICSGTGEFINGVRLVYPMENKSMRYFNLIGNKFFSWLLTWIVGQPIKDTLCGTKVMWRSDYYRMVDNRVNASEIDPFGDFDLLLGAAKLNLKIVDLPVRYRERSYGKTNISRWRHGMLLLKMAMLSINELKFY